MYCHPEPPDSGPETPIATSPIPTEAVRDKVRLTFRKSGSLRWLSHHDLMRTFERMLHRAALPFRRSQGFNPHPRLVFALSLPLGVIGRAEVVELELEQVLPIEEIRDRLKGQSPSGLDILDIKRIDWRQTAHVVGFRYGLTVPAERRAAVRERLDANPLAVECWVERTKPNPRRVDIRPFVKALRLDETTGWFEMDLYLTPQGTARPEEILSLVGLGGLLAEGIALERVHLELDGQAPPSAPESASGADLDSDPNDQPQIEAEAE